MVMPILTPVTEVAIVMLCLIPVTLRSSNLEAFFDTGNSVMAIRSLLWNPIILTQKLRDRYRLHRHSNRGAVFHTGKTGNRIISVLLFVCLFF